MNGDNYILVSDEYLQALLPGKIELFLLGVTMFGIGLALPAIILEIGQIGGNKYTRICLAGGLIFAWISGIIWKGIRSKRMKILRKRHGGPRNSHKI